MVNAPQMRRHAARALVFTDAPRRLSIFIRPILAVPRERAEHHTAEHSYQARLQSGPRMLGPRVRHEGTNCSFRLAFVRGIYNM